VAANRLMTDWSAEGAEEMQRGVLPAEVDRKP